MLIYASIVSPMPDQFGPYIWFRDGTGFAYDSLQHAIVQKQTAIRLLRVSDVVRHEHERRSRLATKC